MDGNSAQAGTKNKEGPINQRRKRKEGKLWAGTFNSNVEGNPPQDDVHKQFREMCKTRAYHRVKANFLKMVGKHWPISYSPKFNFSEQWQMTNHYTQKEEQTNSTLDNWLNLLELTVMGFAVWGISTMLFFDISIEQEVCISLLFQSALDILRSAPIIGRFTRSEKVHKLFHLLLSLFLSLQLLSTGSRYMHSAWSRVIGIIIVVMIYGKISQIYQTIKYYQISSKYRDILSLFELSSLLMTIIHIFALLLSFITELNPQQNWMAHVGAPSKMWYQKYVYSLYFSSTTLLTVGYGDINPVNIHEILAILLIQFFGIATFGYTVSQIGLVLSNIRHKTERLQKDLSTVERIGKTSKLESDIVRKMRSEVVHNKRLDEDLCLKEENQVINNFSEDLRESKPFPIIEIKLQSNIKVIKQSVFMIINWSGKMQTKIANRLVKQIYKEDQLLLQQPGKQKLFILKSGRVDLINDSQKLTFHKPLKSLTSNQNNQLAVQNVYGYSMLVSDRRIKLKAMAKETSICFTILKSDFLELLTECDDDWHHYHELKSIVNLSSIPEQIQAPSIVNIRQHYLPSVLFLFRRRKEQSGPINTRKKVKSRKTDRRKLAFTSVQMKQQRVNKSSKQQISDEISGRLYSPSLKSLNPSENQHLQFQMCKSYQRYFKKANVENVVIRLSKVNFGKITHKNKNPLPQALT